MKMTFRCKVRYEKVVYEMPACTRCPRVRVVASGAQLVEVYLLVIRDETRRVSSSHVGYFTSTPLNQYDFSRILEVNFWQTI